MLAFAFFRIVLGVALGGEITTEPHRDRTSGNLCQPRGYDNAGAVYRARQTRGQRKRDRQSVRHTDDDVAHRVARSEMLFNVSSLRHQNFPISTSTPITINAAPAARLIHSRGKY